MTLEEYLNSLTMSRFVNSLLEQPPGQVICCNGISGLSLKQYDADFLVAVFDWWKALFDYRLRTGNSFDVTAPLPPTPQVFAAVAAGVFDELTREQLDPNFLATRRGPPPAFRLTCQRPSRSLITANGFTNIIDVERLFFRMISESERRRLAAEGGIRYQSPPLSRGSARRIASVIALGRAQALTLETSPTGVRRPHIGNPNGVLWVTPRDAVRDDINDQAPADTVRDALGLVHYEEGRSLAALHLRRETVESRASGRPTFTDAGSHRRFRARADTVAARRKSAWGHTVHLRRLARGEQIVDGRMERVVDPIPAEAVGQVWVTPLGNTANTRGGAANATEDEEFAARLLGQLGGLDAVRRQLFAVLSC